MVEAEKEEKELEDPTAFNKLNEKLNSLEIDFTVSEHEGVRTSEEAAKVRGATLASGAKALILKYTPKKGAEYIFFLAVVSASKKINWKALKKIIKTKNIMVASSEDVLALTKCITGGIPPFGSIFGLKTYLDSSLIEQGEFTNFNAGLRTKSIQMKVEDFVKAEEPIVTNFTDTGI